MTTASLRPAPKPVSWTNPDASLIDGDNADRPAFPGHLLGPYWDAWSQQVADSKCAPRDYVGASLITLAAALIGNARTVSALSWREPPILWTALVGNPSSGKSPAMDPFADMIADFEAEAADQAESPNGGLIHIDDATAQAAAEVAAENPKGLILTKDELSQWWGRLAQTGGEGFWLKAFGARPETIRRKEKKPIVINRLAICVLGGAQPTTLRSFVSAKENKGFGARWLYVFPKPLKAFRLSEGTDLGDAQALLGRLRALDLVGGHPENLPVAPEVLPQFEAWVGIKKRQAGDDDDGIWGQWLGKQGGVALRIALVLEHLWWAADPYASTETPQYVSSAAMQSAMTFIDDYAMPMAELTLSTAARPAEEQDALKLLRLVSKIEGGQFNARLVGRGQHGQAGRLSDPKIMASACEVLEGACLIRNVGERSDGKKGRRPKLYEVNPLVGSGGR